MRIQGLGVIDFAFRGSKMKVQPAFDKPLAETDCVGCGQCAVVCPTAAISIRTNVTDIWDAIEDVHPGGRTDRAGSPRGSWR